MRKIIRIVRNLVYYLIGKSIGKIFFSKKYIKGQYFDKYDSEGWKWLCSSIVFQKILGKYRGIPWPVSRDIKIGNWRNIEFYPEDIHNFQSSGSYYQAMDAKIIIGKGVYIAPNVGLITANHDIYNLEKHQKGKNISIGNNCWIGMNSIILPGVSLGEHTIVGAGSVVTKSYDEGNIIIAGNPARVIKRLN